MLTNSKKYVIIIRKEAVTASYEELKKALISQIKGETNEKNKQ